MVGLCLRARVHCEIHFFPGHFFQSRNHIAESVALTGDQIKNAFVRRVEKLNDEAAGILDIEKLAEFRTISPECDWLGFEMRPNKTNRAVGIRGIPRPVDERRTDDQKGRSSSVRGIFQNPFGSEFRNSVEGNGVRRGGFDDGGVRCLLAVNCG